MTHTTTAARVAKTEGRAKTEAMLRDIAFVLSLTRRVRDEIVSDLPPRVLDRAAVCVGR